MNICEGLLQNPYLPAKLFAITAVTVTGTYILRYSAILIKGDSITAHSSIPLVCSGVASGGVAYGAMAPSPILNKKQ
jgi:hypothetical protein